MLRGFFLCSDIGLVWYSAGVGRTGCYTIITICCADFFFALILVWFGTALEWGEPVLHHHYNMLHVFCLCSDISLVWYSAGVGRTGCYTIITICCADFFFALILVWFGTALEWGEPVATPSLQYAARVLSSL
jgi:hypothetical protein